jgi:type III secretion protein J
MSGAVLVLIVGLVGCTRTPLYTELTETQANQVQAALLSAGIDAQKTAMAKSKGWSISVDRPDVPQAMSVLTAAGLPRHPSSTLGEIFPKEGFVSSPLEERARYVFALSQEVEHTLMQLDGVVEARVHIAIPERSVLDDKPLSASASVVIIERPDAALESRETDIKAIVTDGIEGLTDINRVTVKFFTRHPADPLATVAHTAQAGAVRRSAWGLSAKWGLPVAGASGLLLCVFAGSTGLGYFRQQRQRASGGSP